MVSSISEKALQNRLNVQKEKYVLFNNVQIALK